MLSMHNGKERDVDGWKALFHQADPRFRVLSITQPPGSRLGIIEVGWVGENEREDDDSGD